MSRCSLCCLLLAVAATNASTIPSYGPPPANTWTGTVSSSSSYGPAQPAANTWTGAVTSTSSSSYSPPAVIHLSGEPHSTQPILPPTLQQWSAPVNTPLYLPHPHAGDQPTQQQGGHYYNYYYGRPASNPIGDLINAKLNLKHAVLGAVFRYFCFDIVM